jgi:hypothetical protein
LREGERKKKREREKVKREREKERKRKNGQNGEAGHLHLHLEVLIFNRIAVIKIQKNNDFRGTKKAKTHFISYIGHNSSKNYDNQYF